MSDLFHCRIEGCEYWVALSGYTVRAIKAMKWHVRTGHRELTGIETRDGGGVVDQWVASSLMELERVP